MRNLFQIKQNVEPEKILTNLINKVHKYKKRDMIFHLVECILNMTMVIKIF